MFAASGVGSKGWQWAARVGSEGRQRAVEQGAMKTGKGQDGGRKEGRISQSCHFPVLYMRESVKGIAGDCKGHCWGQVESWGWHQVGKRF